MAGLITGAFFCSLTRSVLYDMAEVVKRARIPEKDVLMQEIKQAEALMARISSKLQKYNNVPKVDTQEMERALSELRQKMPLCFRGVKISAPIMGKGGNIEFVEITDTDFISLNKP